MNAAIHSFDFTGNAKPEHKTDFEGNPMAFLRDKLFHYEKPKDFIGALIGGHHGSFWTVHQTGFYKLMGWAYDFRPLLTKYVYCVHGQWTSGYAPDRMTLRKLIRGIEGKILEYK